MGALPGTFSRRKESQAPGPRSVGATRARWVRVFGNGNGIGIGIGIEPGTPR